MGRVVINRNTYAYIHELIAQGVYEIGIDGKIWRNKMKTHGILKDIKPKRAENASKKGYLKLTLQMPDGSIKGVQAHRVVWEHFNGSIPEEIQINHKDLNKSNNSLDNLELATQAQNIQHSYDNGRTPSWSKATMYRGRPRITQEQMDAIVADRKLGMSYWQLVRKHDVSFSHTQRICKKGGA